MKKKQTNEIERLKYTIDRFDHYYDSINSKGALFLALQTFITGGLITSYPLLMKSMNKGIIWMHMNMASLIILGVLILILVVYSTMPYLSKGIESLFYFGSIADQNKDEFYKNSKSLKKKKELNDLRNQVHGLAGGLSKKFEKLSWAGKLFILQFILFIPLVILLMINNTTT